jgi:glycosyltransferase involved in cell wall biosynthesis
VTSAGRSVEVIIPTRDRPELLRKAIRSVVAQRYDGPLSIAVVFDQQPVDLSLVDDGAVPVRVVSNVRTPGLAGARNSGIVSSAADLVAFLDDDDEWLPGKLAGQMALLSTASGAPFASASTLVDFRGTRTARLAGMCSVPHERLLESRMSMLHSSGFLIDRAAMTGPLGLVDEASPSSQNEDWDLLLRYSRHHPIVHLDEPLVLVRWNSASTFARAWEGRIAGARWILDKHPDIRASAVGYARLLGQIAFAEAALGRRRAALKTAYRAARMRPTEPRPYLAGMVAAGMSSDRVMGALHRAGRGV